MKLIVGLGNPGEKFQGTRHNLGFEVVDEYARKHNLGTFSEEKKFKAEVLKTELTANNEQLTIILAKPQTYMNQSGLSVKLLSTYYKLPTRDVIVIHDDLDLLLGKMKVRLGGGAGGHHGVESVIKDLGSDNFVRVRLGIGNTQGFLGEHHRSSFNAEKFVVEGFLSGERSKVKSMTKRAICALDAILALGIEKAQNQYN